MDNSRSAFPTDEQFAEACRRALPSLYDCATAAAVLADPAHAGPLAPDERIGVAGFAPARLAEFRAGRDCARRALAALGLPACPLPRGQDRAPVWPAAATGSISHCGTLIAAVVAPRAEARALGLDIENWLPLPPGVAELVRAPGEAAHAGVEHGATLLFSAKEALYKAQAPVTGLFLDFGDVALDLSVETALSGRFRARTINPSHSAASVISAIEGRWRIGADWMATGARLPPSAGR